MTSATKAAQRRHIDALCATELDELLDRHVFGNEHWCRGWAQPLIVGTLRVARCAICGQVLESDVRQRHLRLVPHYTIEQIINVMAQRSASIRRVFALEVFGAMHGGIPCKPSPDNMWSLLTSLSSPSLIAVAALRAVGIIDDDGFVALAQESEARHEIA